MILDDMIRELRALGDPNEVEKRLAEALVKPLRAALTTSLSAGKSSDGKAWAPRKKDGGRPYANAASHLEVAAHGNLVRATIKGPTAYGPYGVRGAPKRPMLPEAGGGIPAEVDRALEEAGRTVFEEMTK